MKNLTKPDEAMSILGNQVRTRAKHCHFWETKAEFLVLKLRFREAEAKPNAIIFIRTKYLTCNSG